MTKKTVVLQVELEKEKDYQFNIIWKTIFVRRRNAYE